MAVEIKYRFNEILERLRKNGGVPQEDLTQSAIERALEGKIARQTIAKLLESEWCDYYARLDSVALLAVYLGCSPQEVLAWRMKDDAEIDMTMAGRWSLIRPTVPMTESEILGEGMYRASLIPENEPAANLLDKAEENTKQAVVARGQKKLLLLMEGSNLIGRDVTLASPEMEAERESGVTYLLFEESGHLSRQHAMLTFYPEDGVLDIRDLKTLNGCYRARGKGGFRRIDPTRPTFLKHRDLLVLGNHLRDDLCKRFRVEIEFLSCEEMKP